jgi:hypothetical protein
MGSTALWSERPTAKIISPFVRAINPAERGVIFLIRADLAIIINSPETDSAA